MQYFVTLSLYWRNTFHNADVQCKCRDIHLELFICNLIIVHHVYNEERRLGDFNYIPGLVIAM